MITRIAKQKQKNKPFWYNAFMCSLVLLLVFACSADEGESVNTPVEIIKEVEVPIEIIKEVEVEKIVEVPVEIERFIETDKEFGFFDYGFVPDYNGLPRAEINGGIPYFGTELVATVGGEHYAELDALGRCGVAIALLSEDTMPKEPRGSIGDIKPSGWHIVKYEGIDGNYLYNRCHLIGWQLSGENDNVRNLITGTRYMNIHGMEPVEDEVAAYIKKTGNHVIYRATPVFLEDELVARGVLLEAKSIEDDSLTINEFCYNVQPDVEIDYRTGESRSTKIESVDDEKQTYSLNDFNNSSPRTDNTIERSQPTTEPLDNTTSSVVSDDANTPAEVQVQDPPTTELATDMYVGNKNSKKFHYSWCSSVVKIAKHNKVVFSESTREEIIDSGYEPCKNCNP